MACLAPDTVSSLFANGLSAEARARVDEHVDECTACRQLIVAVARDRTRDGAAATLRSTEPGELATRHVILAEGDRVGRYQIARFLGAGAMGAVYEAQDPELGRAVALKLVPAGDGASAENRASRLRREAQAMAQLAHPNIVPVFDTGQSEDRLFIAMQRIAGVSLREHVAATNPSQAERLRLVCAAGRGLAAAHAAGVVHRDFKPDNILVDAAGNALVVDFGLARLGALGEPAPASAAPAGDAWATGEGMVMGTPAYMAPEVARGERGDARADQYSFGATLSEVCGELPRRLRHAVHRALSSNPRDRYPSMEALLAALEPPRRRWVWPVGIGAVAIAGLAIAVGLPGTNAVAACERAADNHLGRVWSPDARRELSAHLSALAAPGAATIAATVIARLDRYADDWHRERLEVCEASDVRGEHSASLRDLQTACLDDRLVELSVTRRMLQGLSAPELASAPGFDVLGDLAACTDVRDLARGEPEDPMLAGLERALRGELVEANASILRGRMARAIGLPDLGRPAALATATDVLASARAARLPTIEAHALRVRSHLLDSADPQRAAGFHQALAIGDRLAAHGIRIDALIGLLDGAVTDAGRRGEVPLLVRLIESTLAELPGPQHARRARIAGLRADYHRARNELADAGTLAREAVIHFDADRGRGDPFALNARRLLAGVLRDRGRFDDARVIDAEVLAALRTTYGERHPLVVAALVDQGTSLARNERVADARAVYTEALALAEAVHGPQHPQVAQVQRKLGFLELDGDARTARTWFARALAIIEPLGKPESIAPLLFGAGEAGLALGDAATARTDLERGLALRTSPKDAALLPVARFALARALALTEGDRQRARALASEARAGDPRLAHDVTAWLEAHP